MKIRLNEHFRAFWGKVTPKVGDILDVEKKDEKGYWIRLNNSKEKYLVFYCEADLIPEICPE